MFLACRSAASRVFRVVSRALLSGCLRIQSVLSLLPRGFNRMFWVVAGMFQGVARVFPGWYVWLLGGCFVLSVL